MDKALFEKYINEMKELKKRSAFKDDAPLPVINEEIKEPKPLKETLEPEMEGMGYLIVKVTAVNELYPVGNAKVVIFTGEEENRKIFAEGFTDKSGKTGPFSLKAPAIKYSESPNSSLIPFAYYNILTTAEGFLDTIHLNVQVFDKTTSIQKVNLNSSLSGQENTTIIVNEKPKEEI